MIHLLDGPAGGVTLQLRRAPVLLRVVERLDGLVASWDGLDQIDDVPAADEKIHVYRRVGTPTVGFIDFVDPMAKRKTKPPAVRNRTSMSFFSATLTKGGGTENEKSVNYERIEFEDGTVQERGRPDGLPANATLDDIMQKAFE